HLEFGPSRERPIGKPELAANFIEPEIRPQSECISPIPEKSEPARVLYHDVELIAMHDEQAFLIGSHVIGMIGDFDAAENRPDIVARELIMIARQINHADTL